MFNRISSRRRWFVFVVVLVGFNGLGTWLTIDLLDSYQKVGSIPFPDSYQKVGSIPFRRALRPSNDPLCVKEKLLVSGERDMDCANSSILVFGALTAIGSWLTLTLRGEGRDVFPVAHSDDTIADELVWYRRDQLLNAGINIRYADTASTIILKSSNTLRIIYIPSILESSQIRPADNRLMKNELSKFISVLEVFKGAQICSFMLLTRTFRPAADTLLSGWLYSFETTLAVYHRLYSIPIVFIRTGDLYGPWTRQTLDSISHASYQKGGHLHQCWYIVDVSLIVRTALALKSHCLVITTEDCNATILTPGDHRDVAEGFWDHVDTSMLHPLENSLSSSHMWAKAYITKDTHKEVVMTSYFTTAHDPQWNVSRSPNQFQYIQDWYLSIKRLGMEAVVFP
ncbi:hypothetical protein EMCRGX_G021277 [Ephydatia muelleri]